MSETYSERVCRERKEWKHWVENLAAGDRAFIELGTFRVHLHPVTVHRLTKTRIVIKYPAGHEVAFRKDNGAEVGNRRGGLLIITNEENEARYKESQDKKDLLSATRYLGGCLLEDLTQEELKTIITLHKTIEAREEKE